MLELDVLRTAPGVHPFTVHDWHRMGELGLIDPDARLELISGMVLEMAAMGPPHAVAVARLSRTLGRAVRDSAVVWIQAPVQLDDHSEVVPDLALLRPPITAYDGRLPVAGDVLVVVEVADSTLSFDLGGKLAAYASAGVGEYWVEDVRGSRVVVCADPRGRAYRARRDAQRGDVIVPRSLAQCRVAVADLLPPPA